MENQLTQANIELFLMFSMLKYVGKSLILTIYFNIIYMKWWMNKRVDG